VRKSGWKRDFFVSVDRMIYGDGVESLNVGCTLPADDDLTRSD